MRKTEGGIMETVITVMQAETGEFVASSPNGRTASAPSAEEAVALLQQTPKRFRATHAGLFHDAVRFEELKQAMAEARAAIEADPNRL
jgi:hypothetical protein